jgi:Protein of unknown function (DUF4239)
MGPSIVGLISVVCISVGLLVGVFLQNILPPHHLDAASKDTVKVGAGMLATLTALVLGLLVSSAKSSFDAMNTAIASGGAKVVMLDRVLANYGPETNEARQQLRRSITGAIDRIWSSEKTSPSGLHAAESGTGLDMIQMKLNELAPKNNAQQQLLAQAYQIANDLVQTRLMTIEEQQSVLPPVFLIFLIFWLMVLFLSFGLFAPRNVTVLALLLICALSVSSAIFLVLEMNRPLDGVIKASNAPLREALELIGK